MNLILWERQPSRCLMGDDSVRAQRLRGDLCSDGRMATGTIVLCASRYGVFRLDGCRLCPRRESPHHTALRNSPGAGGWRLKRSSGSSVATEFAGWATANSVLVAKALTTPP